jgi:hypothetical protein
MMLVDGPTGSGLLSFQFWRAKPLEQRGRGRAGIVTAFAGRFGLG